MCSASAQEAEPSCGLVTGYTRPRFSCWLSLLLKLGLQDTGAQGDRAHYLALQKVWGLGIDTVPKSASAPRSGQPRGSRLHPDGPGRRQGLHRQDSCLPSSVYTDWLWTMLPATCVLRRVRETRTTEHQGRGGTGISWLRLAVCLVQVLPRKRSVWLRP